MQSKAEYVLPDKNAAPHTIPLSVSSGYLRCFAEKNTQILVPGKRIVYNEVVWYRGLR